MLKYLSWFGGVSIGKCHQNDTPICNGLLSLCWQNYPHEFLSNWDDQWKSLSLYLKVASLIEIDSTPSCCSNKLTDLNSVDSSFAMAYRDQTMYNVESDNNCMHLNEWRTTVSWPSSLPSNKCPPQHAMNSSACIMSPVNVFSLISLPQTFATYHPPNLSRLEFHYIFLLTLPRPLHLKFGTSSNRSFREVWGKPVWVDQNSTA